jgi:hypothetical protein
MESSSHEYIKDFCDSVQNGITSLGLHEVLNFLLREEEKLVLAYQEQ